MPPDAEFSYADCHVIPIVMLSVIMLTVNMLSAIMLNVIMVSVGVPQKISLIEHSKITIFTMNVKKLIFLTSALDK